MVEAEVARLRAIAPTIPRPECEWEDQPRFGPPATVQQVTAFERAAGFPLPADLRSFLAECGAVIGMSVHNGYLIGGVEQLVRSIDRGDFPKSVAGEPATPVGTDGGGNAFLLSSSSKVWRWDRETGNVSVVAGSFGEFLRRVADDWAAYAADASGWSYLV